MTGGNIHGARTLEDAARAAVALARGARPEAVAEKVPVPPGIPRLAPGQHYIRGLFSGGTFCFQATMLLQEALDVHSNTKVGKSHPLKDMWKSEGHTVVDLGDDVFTRGRPHPMIDYRLRTERIVQEASDPQTAVLHGGRGHSVHRRGARLHRAHPRHPSRLGGFTGGCSRILAVRTRLPRCALAKR